jgi:carboxymethylenebutenolidase
VDKNKTIQDHHVIELYEDYVHEHMDRRLFLERLSRHVGSMGVALSLLPLLQPNYALAAEIAENDPRLTAERVRFPVHTGQMEAYYARPKEGANRGAVVIIHQITGLNPQIEDVTRRYAAEGYLALAPDFLASSGGTPKDVDETRKRVRALSLPDVTEDGKRCIAWLRSQSQSNGKVGIVGFCWGGTVANWLAAREPSLNAAVSYYGGTAEIADVPNIKAPLLLHYADLTLDTRLASLMPPFRMALEEHKKPFALYVYEGAQHAFSDHSTPERYNAAATKLAWQRTTEFLTKHVR